MILEKKLYRFSFLKLVGLKRMMIGSFTTRTIGLIALNMVYGKMMAMIG